MNVLPPTPLIDLLTDAAAGLGDAERRILRAMNGDFPRSLRRGPAALLRGADAGPQDLERLLTAVGLAGFDELIARAEAEEDRGLTTPQARFGARLQHRSTARDLLDRVAERERANLEATVRALRDNGALELAAERVVAARRRFVVGGSRSRAYAALLAADLSAGMANVTEVDGVVVRPVDVLGDVRDGDLLVAFSFRRYVRQTLALAEGFRAAGGTVIGITDADDAPLARTADIALIVATTSASYADSPTAVAAVAHIIATLATARAKGARRRLDRRGAAAEALGLYEEG